MSSNPESTPHKKFISEAAAEAVIVQSASCCCCFMTQCTVQAGGQMGPAKVNGVGKVNDPPITTKQFAPEQGIQPSSAPVERPSRGLAALVSSQWPTEI